MKFYNQSYESNYEELLSYYPRFYKEIFEMVEILKAHGRIADGLEDNIEQIYLNCFIDYADETTIEKLEKFLGIVPKRIYTLADRRRLVKSYFVGFGKVSASLLETVINGYTHAAVECRLEPFDKEGNHALFIKAERGLEQILYIEEIFAFLKRKVPAHLLLHFSLKCSSIVPAKQVIVTHLNVVGIIKVKPKLKGAIQTDTITVQSVAKVSERNELKVKSKLETVLNGKAAKEQALAFQAAANFIQIKNKED